MNVESYPKNRREMDAIIATRTRRKWMVRAIAWPIIIAVTIGADIFTCHALKVHEQSAQLLIGATFGGIAARLMALF